MESGLRAGQAASLGRQGAEPKNKAYGVFKLGLRFNHRRRRILLFSCFSHNFHNFHIFFIENVMFLLDFFKNLCPGDGFFSPGPAKFHKTITFLTKKVDFFTKSTFIFNIRLEKY